MFTFDKIGYLFIKDICLENLTILYISSSPDIHGFPEVYYKITDHKFDYNYIFDLLNYSNE